jgi:hypothetical protein
MRELYIFETPGTVNFSDQPPNHKIHLIQTRAAGPEAQGQHEEDEGGQGGQGRRGRRRRRAPDATPGAGVSKPRAFQI